MPSKRLKYGVRVPHTVKEALALDNQNGNRPREKAIKREMHAMLENDYTYFEFNDSGYNPEVEYQKTHLHIIFDVKTDLR